MMFNRPAIEAELRNGLPEKERHTDIADGWCHMIATLVLAGKVSIRYDAQGRQILHGIRFKRKDA